MGSSERSKRHETVLHLPLGRCGYREGLSIQRRLHARRLAGEIPDVLITVEHDPVFTVGRSGSDASILAPSESLAREGIEVIEVERGGDVTYHGPGQLVSYPIVDLRGYGRDIKGYIHRLEQAAIDTLASFGISGSRRPGHPGVWVDGRKIASIGVYVRRWVTMHGIALNVATDPAHFAMIRPGGLDVEAVSMSELIGRGVDLDEVRPVFLSKISSLFDWRLKETALDPLLEEDETP